MTWLGMDIGGANVKVADGAGFAKSSSFALWRQPDRLSHELRRMIGDAPESDGLAVTMTGELADCFETKSDGVRFILGAVADAAGGRQICVYQANGKMVGVEVAEQMPLLAAAANWHALAAFAGRLAGHGASLLVDIGSTTCDVVPLCDGEPFGAQTSDTERLLSGQLVYTGVGRSPVCGLVNQVPYRNQQCAVANELFATALDAYLMLGEISEGGASTETADGRPATRAAAAGRLGRMICADENQFNDRDAMGMAEAIAAAQTQSIDAAVERVVATLPSIPHNIVISGQGEFLARRVVRQVLKSAAVISLSDHLGSVVSQCATAHAVAVLAREAFRS